MCRSRDLRRSGVVFANVFSQAAAAPMHVTLIVNPVAGKHGSRSETVRRDIEEATARLRRGGADVQSLITERAGHGRDLAAQAVAAGTDVVAAWGGDGTINEVATALGGLAVPLAVLPAGSGSGLARALGIPLAWRKALGIVLRGGDRVIDLGQIAGRVFVNVAGVGLDAHIARVFNAERRGRLGLVTYVRLTVRELRRYTPVACRIRLAQETVDVRPLLVALANSSQYGNGARIAPMARLDDGLLDVVIVRASTPLRDLLRARRLFDGSLARDPLTTVRLADGLSIEAAESIRFHVDGEPCDGDTVLNVGVRRAALRVKVPA